MEQRYCLQLCFMFTKIFGLINCFGKLQHQWVPLEQVIGFITFRIGSEVYCSSYCLFRLCFSEYTIILCIHMQKYRAGPIFSIICKRAPVYISATPAHKARPAIAKQWMPNYINVKGFILQSVHQMARWLMNSCSEWLISMGRAMPGSESMCNSRCVNVYSPPQMQSGREGGAEPERCAYFKSLQHSSRGPFSMIHYAYNSGSPWYFSYLLDVSCHL